MRKASFSCLNRPSSTRSTIQTQCLSLNINNFNHNRHASSTTSTDDSNINIDTEDSKCKLRLSQPQVSLEGGCIPDKFEGDPNTPGYANVYSPEYVDSMLKKVENDMPVFDMADPFEKVHKRCFLCTKNIPLDHKNVRMLSQFVSPYTGRIYGRAITGLCIPMQRQVAKYIKRARLSGYMPYVIKDPRYYQDPSPFDKMSRTDWLYKGSSNP